MDRHPSCAQLVAGTQYPGEFVAKLCMVVQHELGSDMAPEVATLASYSTIVRNVDVFCGWCTLLVAHVHTLCHCDGGCRGHLDRTNYVATLASHIIFLRNADVF